MANEKVETKGKPERKKPIRPLGVPVDKLEVTNKQAGMHYCWVNETDVHLYIDAGYEHVSRDDPERIASSDMTGTSGGVGSTVSKIVDRNGRRDFLMRISEEDWKAQQELRNVESEAPVRQILEGDGYSFKGSYTPKR